MPQPRRERSVLIRHPAPRNQNAFKGLQRSSASPFPCPSSSHPALHCLCQSAVEFAPWIGQLPRTSIALGSVGIAAASLWNAIMAKRVAKGS